MFSNYFVEQSKELKSKLKKRLAVSSKKVKTKGKDYNLYKDLYQFFENHLSSDFSIGPGKIRSKSHMLSREVDAIFYQKWNPKLIEMMNGWHLIDYTKTIMSIDQNLDSQSIVNFIQMTQAVKTLYAKYYNIEDNQYVPVNSILWSYDSKIPLRSHQKAIYDALEEKKVPFNLEPDLFIILSQAIIVKDWENMNFKVIETGKDTLMWAYILLTEYLGLDEKVPFNARDFVKKNETYNEF